MLRAKQFLSNYRASLFWGKLEPVMLKGLRESLGAPAGPNYGLEAIGQLEAKTAAILLDYVLDVEPGGGIAIFAIQHVVNAG